MSFIDDNFLLQSKTAQFLYHDHAEEQPILDYHCHIPAAIIAENRPFGNLFELWLAGDHYKWRAMRANGVGERYITGDADPYEKFLAWAATVPRCLRNPLYHWTHLELKRYFGIDKLLDENTAPAIWKRANQALSKAALTPQGILKKFRVLGLCTSDDPADDLRAHATLANSKLATRVYPTFRPDRALDVDLPEPFNAWLDRLGGAAGIEITKFGELIDALAKRHAHFHQMGCRLSDHGLPYCYAEDCTEATAAVIFDQARAGRHVTAAEHDAFASYLMLFFGHLDAQAGWTKQLHLGAQRNCSTRGLKALGPNTGYDSVGDWPQAERLAAYLDRLDAENALPKVVLYNSNPVDSYVFATMAGNFQSGDVPGKVQFGAAWWFLDQKEGIESQMNTLSNVGLLSNFIGMLTDSRSLMSYPRHEYFRRILCNLMGREIENGELPDGKKLAGEMIEDICFRNAFNYLGLVTTSKSARLKS
ncbi:MAG TPA: glucuronate isomerase [Candidatus Sulfotelmatobacter sp.]|nr:glucuronate isomerase [Candidatus Sulfotelmatobacter sp.]